MKELAAYMQTFNAYSKSCNDYAQLFGSRTKSLLFAPKASEHHFDSAIKAVENQRIARIVKTALFIFSTITATTLLTLSEASAIAWPIVLPALAVTLVAWGIFYRLNSLDKRYVEGLDDNTRVTLAKKELERLFFSQPHPSPDAIQKALQGINHLLEYPVFSPEYIQNAQKTAGSDKLSLKLQEEWFEKGWYGLPSFNRSLTVQWDGQTAESIVIERSSAEIDPKTKIPVLQKADEECKSTE